MDPRQKNIRKDPFGQSVTRQVLTPTPIEQHPTTSQPHNPPPTGVKQPISNKSLQFSQTKYTPTTEVENKIDESILREYETLKQYNCSKNFIRTTCEKLPSNNGILRDASFPIGMIINPYCFYENELPIVNYGDKEIPRCISSTCRAYINPFVKWIEGGEKWICNICGYINDTADYYYSRLDKNNNRVDKEEKTDINCGSYEFIANSTYMKKDKPVAQPVYVFVIDVSIASYQNGFLSAVLETLKDLIKSEALNNIEKVKVSIVIYNKNDNYLIDFDKKISEKYKSS
jgi:protein transport protein SEC24